MPEVFCLAVVIIAVLVAVLVTMWALTKRKR
jgi:hypothetical protein